MDVLRTLENSQTLESPLRIELLQEESARKEIEVRVGQKMLHLKRKLSLSAGEESQLQAIFIEDSLENRQMFHQSRKEPRDVQTEVEALRAKRDLKIKEILPVEKFGRYQELKDCQRGFPGGGMLWRGHKRSRSNGNAPTLQGGSNPGS